MDQVGNDLEGSREADGRKEGDEGEERKEKEGEEMKRRRGEKDEEEPRHFSIILTAILA